MGITDFQKNKKEYLQFCVNRKNLDSKTIKSYSIDLKQFEQFMSVNKLEWQEKKSIEKYIESLHITN